MAKVTYLDPIDHISGKISRKHRTVYCYRTGTGAKYTQQHTAPTGEPTAAQLATKSRFKQAAQQTNAIMLDIDRLTPYRQQWISKVKSGTTQYKTLRGYIFAQVYKSL